jgi:hypothetical protein
VAFDATEEENLEKEEVGEIVSKYTCGFCVSDHKKGDTFRCIECGFYLCVDCANNTQSIASKEDNKGNCPKCKGSIIRLEKNYKYKSVVNFLRSFAPKGMLKE